MKNIFNFIKLKKEAVLLDSGLYILKTFIAVLAAYYISYHNPILKLDIISVLFGLMLTLEPVNITGIRNGLNQIYSTCLGALCTAAIIYIGGINVVTIALSIAFTLYVCLKIDWRAVSPVAIFSSIYMTQYVQKTPMGEPSILLTFRLRIFALVSGVVIAIIFNYIFSKLYYLSMVNRRITFLLQGVIDAVEATKEGIKTNNAELIKKSKLNLPNSFNNIDWVFSLFTDMKKEYSSKGKLFKFSVQDIEKLLNVVLFIRSIAHLNYDINYVLLDCKEVFNSDLYKDKVYGALDTITAELRNLRNEIESNGILEFQGVKTTALYEDLSNYKDETYLRILQDLRSISGIIESINNELINIKII